MNVQVRDHNPLVTPTEGRCIFRGAIYEFVVRGVDGKEATYEISISTDYMGDDYPWSESWGTPIDSIQSAMDEEMHPNCVLLRYRMKYGDAARKADLARGGDPKLSGYLDFPSLEPWKEVSPLVRT